MFSIRLMKGKFGRLSSSLLQIIDSFSPIVRVRTKLKRKWRCFYFFFHSEIILEYRYLEAGHYISYKYIYIQMGTVYIVFNVTNQTEFQKLSFRFNKNTINLSNNTKLLFYFLFILLILPTNFFPYCSLNLKSIFNKLGTYLIFNR